jgi:hypothetical protein
MRKKYLIGAGLSLCVAACASTPSGPGAATSGAAAAPRLPSVGCVSSTATRISPGECAGFGRTWTDQDIRTTGATNAGQALRLLDPSVTVTGH